MAAEDINIGEKIANVPVGELIYSVAMGIAKAQWELNKSSMVSAELMSGSRILRDLDTGRPLLDAAGKPQRDDTRVYFGYDYALNPNTGTFTREPRLVSMLELGFTPTFYQFVDTVIEVKVEIKVHKGVTTTRTDKGKNEQTNGSLAVASSVDAAYSQTYNYSAEGSSMVRTKLVPIPPPAILEERIRIVMNGERQIQQLFQGQMEAYLTERKSLLGRSATQQELDANNTKITQLQASASKEGATINRPSDEDLKKNQI